jgi:hypothetical protein
MSDPGDQSIIAEFRAGTIPDWSSNLKANHNIQIKVEGETIDGLQTISTTATRL